MSQISSEPILHFRVPYPVLEKTSRKTKRKSVTLVTMNNVLTWKRFYETKIKAKFKQLLIDYYLPEPATTYDSLHVKYRIIRHNKRKIDPDSAAFVMKWFIDVLEKLGYVEDDRYVTVSSFPTLVHPEQETLIEIKVYAGSVKW